MSGGTLVVVGTQGTIRTSSDALNWNTATSGTMNDLTAITNLGSTYVAVRENGTILFQQDSWEPWINISSGDNLPLILLLSTTI
jgi:hypothetical protein